MLSLVLTHRAFAAQAAYEIAGNAAKNHYYDTKTDGSAGRAFYESLIESGSKVGWAVPVSFFSSHSNRSFNDCGQSCSLSNLKFGGVRIRDVYLFSRLSDFSWGFRYGCNGWIGLRADNGWGE